MSRTPPSKEGWGSTCMGNGMRACLCAPPLSVCCCRRAQLGRCEKERERPTAEAFQRESEMDRVRTERPLLRFSSLALVRRSAPIPAVCLSTCAATSPSRLCVCFPCLAPLSLLDLARIGAHAPQPPSEKPSQRFVSWLHRNSRCPSSLPAVPRCTLCPLILSSSLSLDPSGSWNTSKHTLPAALLSASQCQT